MAWNILLDGLDHRVVPGVAAMVKQLSDAGLAVENAQRGHRPQADDRQVCRPDQHLRPRPCPCPRRAPRRGPEHQITVRSSKYSPPLPLVNTSSTDLHAGAGRGLWNRGLGPQPISSAARRLPPPSAPRMDQHHLVTYSSSLIASASSPAILRGASSRLPGDAADALDWRLSVMQHLLLGGSSQLFICIIVVVLYHACRAWLCTRSGAWRMRHRSRRRCPLRYAVGF